MTVYLHRAIAQALQLSTYRRLLYLLPGGVLGIAYLAVQNVLVALGVTQVLAWLCVLVLVAATSFVRPLREADRRWTNRVLGTKISPPIQGRVDSTQPLVRRLFGFSDRADWKSAGWIPFRLIFGSQSCALAVMVLLLPIYLLASLIVGLQEYGVDVLSSAKWAIVLAVPGFVVLWVLTCVHANLVASLHAEMAEELLGPSVRAQTAAARLRNHELLLRNQFGRRLHNSVGRRLAGAMAQAGAAQQLLDTDLRFVGRALARIEEESRLALDELSQMVDDWYEDPDLRTLRSEPGPIGETIDEARASGLPLIAEISEEFEELPEYLEREIHDVVREGCTNVLKHAGLVRTWVRVTLEDGVVEAEVLNAAPTTERSERDQAGGFGLRDVRERVEALGGAFLAGSTADGGFRLRVSLPAEQARG